jgi:hypothetical protein
MDDDSRYVFVPGYGNPKIINSALIVMLLAPVDPLGSQETWHPSMMLFIERDFEPARSNIEVLIDTEITVYFKDKVAREKGIPPGTVPIASGTHVFTTEDSVQGVFICRNLGVKWI